MVSKAREDLPDPLRPVMTTSLSRGISTSRFLRLCSRAPRMMIEPAIRGEIITCWIQRRGVIARNGKEPLPSLGENVTARFPRSDPANQSRLKQWIQEVHGPLLGDSEAFPDLTRSEALPIPQHSEEELLFRPQHDLFRTGLSRQALNPQPHALERQV